MKAPKEWFFTSLYAILLVLLEYFGFGAV